jgi:type VI secretion system protein ImpB
MSESIHEKLKRVRKPRVHITYEVETEGAQILKELPFVVGVMGDFSGNNPAQPLKPLAERKFVQIDRDNFNAVMDKMAPGLRFKVDNTLEGIGQEMSVELAFKSMEDFEPAKIVQQIEPLRKLMETRNKLRDLMTKADVSTDLEGLLEDVLQNTEDKRSRLASELGLGGETSEKTDGGSAAATGATEKDDNQPSEESPQ